MKKISKYTKENSIQQNIEIFDDVIKILFWIFQKKIVLQLIPTNNEIYLQINIDAAY